MQKQIAEIRKYCNYLDERIARYRKAGIPTMYLLRNKQHAVETIATLEQVENSQDMPAGAIGL